MFDITYSKRDYQSAINAPLIRSRHTALYNCVVID